MPETVIPEKVETYQIPSFIVPRLPKEFSNEKPEVKPEIKPEVKTETPAAPPEEAKAEPAPATPPETEKATPEEETTGKDPEKPSTRRFERRIDKAIRGRAEAQARADLLERELAELKAKNAPAIPEGSPKAENFTDIEEFRKAVATYERAQAEKDFVSKQREEAAKTAETRLMSDWDRKVEKAEDKYDDFREMVGDLQPKGPMFIALMQEDNGADIAYYLSKHETEADRIAGLDGYSQIREIGKLSIKLSQTPEAKKPSKAPPPITPVVASAVVSDGLKPQMKFEEYMGVRKNLFPRN